MKKTLAIAAALVPVVVAVIGMPATDTRATATTPTPIARPAAQDGLPLLTSFDAIVEPSGDATLEPAATDPTPQVEPAPPVANTKLGVRRWQDPETPEPLPVLTAEQQERFGDCLTTTVATWSKGPCADLVQAELKALGFFTGKPSTRINVSATNAILRYQRSRDLKPTGTVEETTWYALASGKPARSKDLPPECLLPGVVLCVDQGHEELNYVEDGEVIKTVRIRTGGYTSHAKTKKWRVFPTANGLFKVYTKHVNPPSENYGSGAMPYSVIFDPNMYVHYSSDFRRRGYNTSSHGCVNVASLDDAKWLYKTTPLGAHVYIY